MIASFGSISDQFHARGACGLRERSPWCTAASGGIIQEKNTRLEALGGILIRQERVMSSSAVHP
jgi:hypothetical protein